MRIPDEQLVLFEQRHGGNQHSRRADPALRSAMLEKGFLQAIKGGTGFTQPFNRDDLRAWQLPDRHQA